MEIEKIKFKDKCPQHPDIKVELLQVENLDAYQNDHNLFYCLLCAYQDSTFNIKNYQIIQQITKSKTDQILPRWPPVNNDQLIDKLIEITIENEEMESVIVQIETYFTDLRDQILKQIDIQQKKMIQLAEEIPENKIKIMNRYTELSKINELRTLLSDHNSDIPDKNRKYRALFNKILSEKKAITEQLTSLLNQFQQKQTIFNSEAALEIKQSILQSLSSINLFQSRKISNNNDNNNIKDNNNINNKQMKLDLSLIKTDYNKDQSSQEITKNKNNQYQVKIIQQNDWLNIISNTELQRKKKYIFRIEIQNMIDGQSCMIGLMKDTNINTKEGFKDYLSCYLECDTNQIAKSNYSQGIDKVVKGNKFVLSKDNVIELRVSIEDQILEVLDFPNYHCKLALQEKYKSNLINNNNLRLYLGLIHLNNTMILKEAFTVEKFD